MTITPIAPKEKKPNAWIEHLKKWRQQNAELAKKLPVKEHAKEAKKTYTPVTKVKAEKPLQTN